MSTELMVSEQTQNALAQIPTDRDKKLNQGHTKILLNEFDQLVEGRSALALNQRSQKIDKLKSEYIDNNHEIQSALKDIDGLVASIEACFEVLAKNGVDSKGCFIESENAEAGQWQVHVGQSWGASHDISRAFKCQTKLVDSIQAEREASIDPFSGARIKLAVAGTYGEAAEIMNLVAGKEIL